MCLFCETDDTKFSCCGGCNKGGCMSMGKGNCQAASLCFYCPLRHVYYGCQHCTMCCTSPANMSGSKLAKHRELELKDRCFGNSHKYGAFCCPCTVTTCALGVVGCTMTYVASCLCLAGGCACKTGSCFVSCASKTCTCCSGTGSCCSSAGTVCCCCVCCCPVGSNAVTDQPRSASADEGTKPGPSDGAEADKAAATGYQPDTSVTDTKLGPSDGAEADQPASGDKGAMAGYQPDISGTDTKDHPPPAPAYDDPPPEYKE